MTALATSPPPVVDRGSEAQRVRVRRAPPLEPPFDDECGPVVVIPGTAMLPFAWPSRGPRPHRPVTPRQRRGPAGTTTASTGSHDAGPDDGARLNSGSADGPGSPEAAAPGGAGGGGTAPAVAAAERFLKVCLEVLNGHRPASHLRAVTAPGRFTEVTDQVVRRTGRTYLASTGRPGPVPRRVRLQRLHTCEPRDGVAEVVAVLAYGTSTWAMAARLERHADSWLCTLVHVI